MGVLTKALKIPVMANITAMTLKYNHELPPKNLTAKGYAIIEKPMKRKDSAMIPVLNKEVAFLFDKKTPKMILPINIPATQLVCIKPNCSPENPTTSLVKKGTKTENILAIKKLESMANMSSNSNPFMLFK